MLCLLVSHSSDSLVVALLVESRLLPSSFSQTMKLVCQFASCAKALAPSTSSAQAQAQCCSHQILGGQVTSGSACVSTQQLRGVWGTSSRKNFGI